MKRDSSNTSVLKTTSCWYISIIFILKPLLNASFHTGRQDQAPKHGKQRLAQGLQESLQQRSGTSTDVAHSTHSIPKLSFFLSSLLHNLEGKLQHTKYINTIFLVSKNDFSQHCESFQMMLRILLASGEKKSPDSEQPTSKMPFV